MTKGTRDKDNTKAQGVQKPGAQAARKVNGQSNKKPKATKASKPPKRQKPTGGNSDD